MRTLIKVSILSALVCPTLSFAGQPMTPSDEMHQAMMKSCTQMESVPMNGHPDHDFVVMMIPHHQAAVDAAKAYLKGAKDPDLMKMASNVIAAQEEEIAKMQSWLKEHSE